LATIQALPCPNARASPDTYLWVDVEVRPIQHAEPLQGVGPFRALIISGSDYLHALEDRWNTLKYA
jgi:hypothetical protein